MNNHYGEYDHIFQTKIDSWVPINKAVHDFFTQREIDTLKRSERTFTCADRTVVFLSFENQFASLGGLAAVAHHLPLWLQKLNENVLFFTPLHSKNTKTQDAIKNGKLVPVFSGKTLRICNYQGIVSCYEYSNVPFKSYFLEVDERFCAGDNPYAYEDKTELLIDALAFSAAVPFALAQLGVKSNLIFHAHDWETAPVAITSKLAVISNLINSARTILTLHNSFDSCISQRHKTLFFGKNIPGDTILQCTIPLLNGPLTTVSTPFAHELRHDPLQKGIFTDHLQKVFSMNPPIGIENGMFGEPVPSFSRKAIKNAVTGETDDLLSEKNVLRNKMLDEIKTLKTDPRVRGSLSITGRNSKTPVFFMSGRLDFMQKGFDVIFNAFEKLPPGSAKLLFCPSSTHTDTRELAFFEKIAQKCDGDIIIMPFRLSRGQYNAFLQGASYLLMPSFYEPFGAATEGMMNGTPVVARGTGGLWIQVNPHDGMYVPSFYGSMLDLDKRSDFPTGFLYREDYPDAAAQRNWREVIDLEPSKRLKNPLYTAMVDSAFNALKMAITAFGTKKYYGQMICNGLDSVNQFTWQRAVGKYKKIYDAVCFRGSL